MDNENLYKNLVLLIKMFKNRPHHLAKYLIDNSALTENFINAVEENARLKKIDMSDDDSRLPVIYFADINQMNEYYNSLTEENKTKSPEEVEKSINEKLKSLIEEERYEDAARLRDYMQKLLGIETKHLM
jgi:hypothetical protein